MKQNIDTQKQYIYFQLGLTTGAHAASENKDPTGNIELLPVNAFRIEPDMAHIG